MRSVFFNLQTGFCRSIGRETVVVANFMRTSHLSECVRTQDLRQSDSFRRGGVVTTGCCAYAKDRVKFSLSGDGVTILTADGCMS